MGERTVTSENLVEVKESIGPFSCHFTTLWLIGFRRLPSEGEIEACKFRAKVEENERAGAFELILNLVGAGSVYFKCKV